MESLRLPTDWPELGNELGWIPRLGSWTCRRGDVLALEDKTCQSYHSNACRWLIYRTTLLSALDAAACMPAHILNGSDVPLWLAPRGVKGSKIRVKMCVEGKRETKRIIVLKWIYLLWIKEGTLSHTLMADSSGRTPLTVNPRILTTDNYMQSYLLNLNTFLLILQLSTYSCLKLPKSS